MRKVFDNTTLPSYRCPKVSRVQWRASFVILYIDSTNRSGPTYSKHERTAFLERVELDSVIPYLRALYI